MKFNVVAKDVRSLPLNKQDVLIIIWRQAGTSRFGDVEIKSAAATGFSFHLTGLFLQVRPVPQWSPEELLGTAGSAGGKYLLADALPVAQQQYQYTEGTNNINNITIIVACNITPSFTTGIYH